MFDQPYIKIVDLLRTLEDGDVDIVQFGRAFQRKSGWAAELYTSLCRDPQLPIGGFVWWLPPEQERPRSGRYQKDTVAKVFIVDGQQRSTALAGGAGIRPACYPDETWRELGGPELEVGIVLESTRRLRVRPMKTRRHPQVRLGDLLRADTNDIPDLVAAAGAGSRTHEASQFAVCLTHMRDRLLETEISVAWLRGGIDDAVESYRVLNQPSSTKTASAAEIQTQCLGVAAPGVRREVLDPLSVRARRAGFGKVVTETAVNEIIQRQLPAAHRRRAAKSAQRKVVEAAAQRADKACTGVIAYLQARGLTDESLVYMPTAIHVLMHMAAHFPESFKDDFPRRWLVHALACERYRARPYRATGDIGAMLRASSYAEARRILAESMLPAGPPPPLALSRLTSQRRGRFGIVASLYAMACACPSALEVQDLSDPDLAFPEAPMALVPLWRGKLEFSFGDFILATPATTEVLEQYGGWTKQAYEHLRCGDDALDAQCIPRPQTGPGASSAEELIKTREQELLRVINGFLSRIGPLEIGDTI